MSFVEVLGRGGFGVVYLADVHGRDDFVQRLAIKVLSAEMNEKQDVAARQRDEARLLAQLNHDHIVTVHDLTELHGRPAVMMEYVEGVDAGELLRQAPLPARAALQVVEAAASALDAAWRSPSPRTGKPLRVVHRDIKPENLLVSRHGGVKVLDFGVARADFDREGRTGHVQYGTARFMAPEQWLEARVGPAVDIYALGVSLCEMLGGQLVERAPLAPEAYGQRLEQLVKNMLSEEWEGPWSQELEQLLRGMLAYTPEERLTAEAVHDRVLDLVEAAPGRSLGRLAREVIPPLIAQRRARHAGQPLPPGLGLAGQEAPVAMAPEETAAIGGPSGALDTLDFGTSGDLPAPSQADAASGPSGEISGVQSGTLDLPRPATRGSRLAWVGGAVVGLLGLGALVGLGLLGLKTSGLVEADEEVGATETEGAAPEVEGEAEAAEVDEVVVDAPAVPVETARAPVTPVARSEVVSDVTEEVQGPAGIQGTEDQEDTEEVEDTEDVEVAGEAEELEASGAGSTEPEPPPVDAPGSTEGAPPAVALVADEVSSHEPQPVDETPAAPTWDILIKSQPLGAQLTLDGRSLGATPHWAALSRGTYTVAFTSSGRSRTCQLTVNGWTKGLLWDVAADACKSYQPTASDREGR